MTSSFRAITCSKLKIKTPEQGVKYLTIKTPERHWLFDSIRLRYISGAFKNMCFWKGRRFCRKKLQKVKKGAWVFTLLKSDFTKPVF